MTKTQWIDPEIILTEGVQQGIKAYEETNNIQASAIAVCEVISERYGFASVFAILAGQMNLNWWLLELAPGITIESVLDNVLTGIIAQQLADEVGLDTGNTLERNCQDTKQEQKGPPARPSKPPPIPKSRLQMKQLPRPKPIKP